MGKFWDAMICAAFAAFLLVMSALFLFQEKVDFSEKEKRYLSAMPALTSQEIFSGDLSSDMEACAADHIPARDFFVGLNAWAERAFNLQCTKAVYVGKSGALYERPCREDDAAIARNMEAINAFAKSVGQSVDLILVPTAGSFSPEDVMGLADPYMDGELIRRAYSLAGEGLRPVDIAPVLAAGTEGGERIFYRTDHHWTSLGAYLACADYTDRLGREHPGREDYAVTAVDGFYGTTYTRACLWQFPPETLELWDGGGLFTVSASEAPAAHAGLFYPERLEQADKYPVYLDGNHPLVTIENASEDAEGRILVIRDSYANCMGCFLADSFKTVVMADLRYYKEPLSELCRDGDFDAVLVLYSISSFMTDSNIVWLS